MKNKRYLHKFITVCGGNCKTITQQNERYLCLSGKRIARFEPFPCQKRREEEKNKEQGPCQTVAECMV